MSTIVTAPSAILRQPAKPVEALDKRVLSVLQDMEKTLKAAKDPQGVGLAAPQIGVGLRIFLIRPDLDGPILTFINPEIVKFSQSLTKPTGKNGVYEGCLSIPQHYAPIVRSKSVTVKYKDDKFVDQQKSFTGFSAHVIQHEMDHLNGILFIDRVLQQDTKLYKIDGEDWQEVSL